MKALKYILCYLLFFILSYLLFENNFELVITSILATICAIISIFLLAKTSVLNANFNTIFFITVFTLILFIPFVGKKEQDSLEKRKLKDFPEWRWTNVWKFFKEYQSYFNDRFAFKNSLVDFYGKLKYEKLSLTYMTSDIAFGEDNWLFYKDKDYLNRISKPFTEKELRQLHYNLVVTTKWFEQHGIKYYLTIPPVKPRIYNDKTPYYFRINTKHSILEQLNTYLIEKSKIQLIDLRDELLDAKNKHQLYYKTDTHWNQYGAYVGYKKIIETFNNDFPELEPIKISMMEKSTKDFMGDLTQILGYKSAREKLDFTLTPKDTFLTPQLTLFINPTDNTSHKLEVWDVKKGLSDLKIYVVRDSFSENLKYFLSINFSTSYYAWTTDVPVEEVLQKKPDIVLHEILERFAFFYLKLPPEIKADTAFTNQFNIADF